MEAWTFVTSGQNLFLLLFFEENSLNLCLGLKLHSIIKRFSQNRQASYFGERRTKIQPVQSNRSHLFLVSRFHSIWSTIEFRSHCIVWSILETSVTVIQTTRSCVRIKSKFLVSTSYTVFGYITSVLSVISSRLMRPC